MIIQFNNPFYPNLFKSGIYSLDTEWIKLLKSTLVSEGQSGFRYTDTEIYTTRLGDLIEFGKWLIESPYCPIYVSVILNGRPYFYGPEGDLHRQTILETDMDNIPLSQYKRSE